MRKLENKRMSLLWCGLLCALLMSGCSGMLQSLADGTDAVLGGLANGADQVTGALAVEEGEAAVFLCSGAEEPVLLLSESGDYSGTIEVGSGSVYLGVWGEGLTGSVSIQIE